MAVMRNQKLHDLPSLRAAWVKAGGAAAIYLKTNPNSYHNDGRRLTPTEVC
jgi:hypothetical protein